MLDFIFEEKDLYDLFDCIRKGRIFKGSNPNKINYLWVDRHSLSAYGVSLPPTKEDNTTVKTEKAAKSIKPKEKS